MIKELKVLSVKWKSIELTATKKQFDSGHKTHAISPIVECELPNDIEVFGGEKPQVFAVYNRKMIGLVMCGYHLGNKMIAFESYEKFDKEFPIKAYYL